MVTHNEISSTEKLLDLIRGKKNTGDGVPKEIALLSSWKRLKAFLAKIMPLQRSVTVGVAFGYHDLKLVKIRRSFDNKLELLSYTSFPFDPDIPEESFEFTLFLKATLSDFCGSSEKFELWSLMSVARVDIRYIRIPRIPKKQVANAVYWSFKKEVPFDEENCVLDFEILGDITERGIEKTAVIAIAAPKLEVARLQDLFSKSGFPLTGISTAPFAIQNLFRSRWIESGDENVCNLYVGRNWSRVDIFFSGNLVLTRGIKAGMNSIIESIIEGMKGSFESEPSESAKEEKGPAHLNIEGETGINWEQARKILFRLGFGPPDFGENEPGFNLEKEEIFEILLPALERLVRQIERSFDYYVMNFENGPVTKSYISGEINLFKPLVDYISNEVNQSFGKFDPLAPGTDFLDKDLKTDSIAERVSNSFAPAVGMALSDNFRTPNCIFTYKDKEKRTRAVNINRGIFAGFILIMAVCLGVLFWQGQDGNEKKARLTELRRELERYSIPLDKNFIIQLTARAKQKRDMLKEYSRKYQGMAVLGELSRLSLPDVHLLNVKIYLGKVPEDNKGGKVTKTLILNGIISGDKKTLEASLTSYLLSLEGCSLIRQPSIRKNNFEIFEGKEILRFSMFMELV